MGLYKLKKTLLLTALSLAPLSQYASNRELANETMLVRSIDEFTFDLHRRSSKDFKSNLVHSPFSIYTALSLVSQGARGQTSLQMARTLRLPYFGEKLGSALHTLQGAMIGKKESNDYALNFGNSVWFNFDTILTTNFLNVAENCYEAKIQSLDFDDSATTVGTINQWVSNQTEGKIPKLLSQGDISSSTKMAIVNTVFFDGSWLKPFNKRLTTNDLFYSMGKTYENVPMMEQTDYFLYSETDKCQMMSLPFKKKNTDSSDLAFVVILPKKTSSIGDLGTAQNSFAFTTELSNMDQRKLHITMPKIDMDIKQNLESTLSDMGMPMAFSRNADFTGMSSNQDLSISKIIHQAYFKADEDGVCAAAATAVTMVATCVKIPPESPIEMIINRPFMFFIVDLKSQAILFSGNYVTPNEGTEK